MANKPMIPSGPMTRDEALRAIEGALDFQAFHGIADVEYDADIVSHFLRTLNEAKRYARKHLGHADAGIRCEACGAWPMLEAGDILICRNCDRQQEQVIT